MRRDCRALPKFPRSKHMAEAVDRGTEMILRCERNRRDLSEHFEDGVGTLSFGFV